MGAPGSARGRLARFPRTSGASLARQPGAPRRESRSAPLSETRLARDGSSASMWRRSRLQPTRGRPCWSSCGKRPALSVRASCGCWDRTHRRSRCWRRAALSIGTSPNVTRRSSPTPRRRSPAPRVAIADDCVMPSACVTGQPKSRSSRSRSASTAARTRGAPPPRWRSALGCGNRPDQRCRQG